MPLSKEESKELSEVVTPVKAEPSNRRKYLLAFGLILLLATSLSFLIIGFLQSNVSLGEQDDNSSSSAAPTPIITANLRNYGVDGSNRNKLTEIKLSFDGAQLVNQSISSVVIQKDSTYLILRTDGEDGPNTFDQMPDINELSGTYLPSPVYRIAQSMPDLAIAKRYQLTGDFYYYISHYVLVGEDNPLHTTGAVAVGDFNFDIDQGDISSLINISCFTQEPTSETCDDLVKNLQVTLAEEGLHDFDGEFIKAVEPEGWSIKEYDDTSGMFSTTGTVQNPTTYSGLTKLEVFDPNGKSVFSISGKDGVGYLNVCPDIYKFADTDTEYIDQKLSASINIDQKEANVVTLSDISYSSFTFFNIDLRRLGSKFYYNTNESLTNFHPSCGASEFNIGFNDKPNSPYYLINQTGPQSLYEWKYDISKLSEEQIMELEEILFSMRLK